MKDLIKQIIGEHIENKQINEETFSFNNLSDDEKNRIYNVFKSSYEKSTGKSWDQNKFQYKASDWLFFGRDDGFITVRKQNSGMYKLTGAAGSLKSIMQGVEELNSLNTPVWGLMTEKMAKVLKNKYGYIMPPAFLSKYIFGILSKSILGNNNTSINQNGSLTLKYSDVGDATKYFVANKLYYKYLFANILPNMAGVPNIIKLAVKRLAN